MGRIPECLTQLIEFKKALAEAEDLKTAMTASPKEKKINLELEFLDKQIADYKRKVSKLDKDSDKFFRILKRKNYRAYIAAEFHYRYGLTWDEVSDYIGGTPDALRGSVAYTLKNLDYKD